MLGAATDSSLLSSQSCLSASHSTEVVIEIKKKVADCKGRDKRIENQHIQNQKQAGRKDSKCE